MKQFSEIKVRRFLPWKTIIVTAAIFIAIVTMTSAFNDNNNYSRIDDKKLTSVNKDSIESVEAFKKV